MSPATSRIARHPNLSCSIAALASETLLEIFDLLLQDAKISMESTKYDLSSLFPFACASVCHRWLDIITLQSKYWINAVVPLDFPIIPSVMDTYHRMLEQQTTKSVHVALCDVAAAMDVRTEHARLVAGTRSLETHWLNNKTISIRTRYRSSILLITPHFNSAIISTLERLSLVSEIANTVEGAEFAPFDVNKLKSLSLDAKTVVGFAKSHGRWKLTEGLELYITPYHPRNVDSPALTTSVFMSALVKLSLSYEWLRSLAIADVILDNRDPTPSGPLLTEVAHVRLIDLEGPFIRKFFANFFPPDDINDMDPREVTFTRCKLDHPIDIPHTSTLELREMSDTASILHALSEWEGMTLELVDCPGVTDAVLALMRQDSLCSVFNLVVNNCNVSVAGLLSLVASRCHAIDISPIHDLDVSGGPALSLTERQAFMDVVSEELEWNGEVIKSWLLRLKGAT